MKNKVKKYWPYFVVVLAIILPWFFHSGYLFSTDMAWGPHIDLDWTNSWFLVNLIIKIFSFVLPMAFLEKVFIGLTIFAVLVGGRKVANYFIKDKLAALVISLFVLFNPFVYDRFLYGQTGVVLAFGFFLLAIAYLLEYLDSREDKKIILFAVFTAITLQFSVHFIFFIGLIFLFFLVLYFKKWKLNDWKHFLGRLLIAGVICILLNANWLIAVPLGRNNTANFVSGHNITGQDLQAFKTSGSSDSAVLRNVTMMSGFWGKDQYRYTDLTKVENNWGRSFLFLLPIIILGLIWGIKKRDTRLLSIGLLIIFLVSVILASGVALSATAPFSYWLFDHFPLYKGLRESQKWVAVIVLVYAIFLSIGTAVLLKTKIVSDNRRISLIFLSAVVIMQAPLLLWGFDRQVIPVQYPADWVQVDKSLECSNNNKALFLPWHLYMSFSWTNQIIANPAKLFFSCPIISGTDMEWGGIYDNSQSAEGAKVLKWLDSNGQNTDLFHDKELGIKYIILAKEIDWQKYSWIDVLPSATLFQETETLRMYKINE